MLTADSRRRDFPSLERMVYLNTAAESIPPTQAGIALQEYWEDKLKGMKGREGHYERLEMCRKAAARALNLSSPEVSFCSCSAEAYNLLATALDLQPGDEVVVNNLDFPSGATPWFVSRKSPGVKVWNAKEGSLQISDLERLLGPKTRLVQTSLVSFYNGYRLDWPRFVRTVRSLAPNAIISVDLTQALGRVPLDCSDADCIISSTHKWILGIHGGCIVGIPKAKSDALTARAGGWFNLENAFEPNRFERVVIKPGAASYSAGMPNFAAIYVLESALRYIEMVGVANIAAHADPLVKRAWQGLLNLGIPPLGPLQHGAGSGIISFQHVRGAEIHSALEAKGIHVMHHAGRIRISIHGYNRAEEITTLLDELSRILKK